MAKFTVTFERSAVQIRNIVVDAHTAENAEKIAKRVIEGGTDQRVLGSGNEFSGDTESVWELVDTETWD